MRAARKLGGVVWADEANIRLDRNEIRILSEQIFFDLLGSSSSGGLLAIRSLIENKNVVRLDRLDHKLDEEYGRVLLALEESQTRIIDFAQSLRSLFWLVNQYYGALDRRFKEDFQSGDTNRTEDTDDALVRPHVDELSRVIPDLPRNPRELYSDLHPPFYRSAVPQRKDDFEARMDSLHRELTDRDSARGRQRNDVQHFMNEAQDSGVCGSLFKLWQDTQAVAHDFRPFPAVDADDSVAWRFLAQLPVWELDGAWAALRVIQEKTMPGSQLGGRANDLVSRLAATWTGLSGRAARDASGALRDGIENLSLLCKEMGNLLVPILTSVDRAFRRLSEYVRKTRLFQEGAHNILERDPRLVYQDLCGIQSYVTGTRLYPVGLSEMTGRLRMPQFDAAIAARVQREQRELGTDFSHVVLTLDELRMTGSPMCREDADDSEPTEYAIKRLERFEQAYRESVREAMDDQGFRRILTDCVREVREGAVKLSDQLRDLNPNYFTHPPLPV